MRQLHLRNLKDGACTKSLQQRIQICMANSVPDPSAQPIQCPDLTVLKPIPCPDTTGAQPIPCPDTTGAQPIQVPSPYSDQTPQGCPAHTVSALLTCNLGIQEVQLCDARCWKEVRQATHLNAGWRLMNRVIPFHITMEICIPRPSSVTTTEGVEESVDWGLVNGGPVA